MSWTVYGEPYTAGQLSGLAVYQPIKFTSNMIVKAIRVWVVVVGAPVLTGLRMKIYGNNEQTPGPSLLLSTSTNSWDMATLLTSYSNGVKEIYFEFDPLTVEGANTYNLVLAADSYTPSGSDEFAWRTVWPDPVYTTNFTVTGNNYLTSPKFVSAVIGSPL